MTRTSHSRRRSLAYAVCAIGLIALAGAAAAADECQLEPLEREKIVAALGEAQTCEAAYSLMNACRTNTSGDVEFAEVVIAKCEASFVGRLTGEQKAAYAKEREACAKKYAGEHGTMYVSFAATCEAGVAVRYAKRWGKAGSAQ